MVETAKQVLGSQHAFVTRRAVVTLQQEGQERRQQQQLQLFVRIRIKGKVKTNASKSLQMSYDHYKCIAINKNGLRLLSVRKYCESNENMLSWRILGACP